MFIEIVNECGRLNYSMENCIGQLNKRIQTQDKIVQAQAQLLDDQAIRIQNLEELVRNCAVSERELHRKKGIIALQNSLLHTKDQRIQHLGEVIDQLKEEALGEDEVAWSASEVELVKQSLLASLKKIRQQDQTIQNIIHLIQTNPNDQELGEKIRQLL